MREVMRRNLTLLAHLSAVLLAGCVGTVVGGDDTGPEDEPGDEDDGDEAEEVASCEPTAGSRLKLAVTEHDDGSSAVLGFFDSERGERCEFADAGDGVLRCLPDLDALGPFSVGMINYTDAACTSPVVASYVDAPTPTVVHSVDAGSCTVARRFYAVGAPRSIAADASLYTRDADGSCGEVSWSPDVVRFHAIGAEIPTSAFVAGEPSWSETGRVALRVITGDDGSVACDFDTLVDTELDQACRLVQVDDDDIRCVPRPVAAAVYTGDTCDGTAISGTVVDQCADEVPRMVTESSERCQVRVREVVADQVMSDVMIGDQYGTCEAADVGDTVRRLGEPVDLETLPRFERRYVADGDRLERGELVSGDLATFRRQFRDTLRDMACTFETASDGALRCLPSSNSGSAADMILAYTDEDCQTELRLAMVASDCLPEVPRYVLDRQVEGTTVHELGPVYPGTLYRKTSGGGCERSSTPGTRYSVGPVVSPADFVRGVESVR